MSHVRIIGTNSKRDVTGGYTNTETNDNRGREEICLRVGPTARAPPRSAARTLTLINPIETVTTINALFKYNDMNNNRYVSKCTIYNSVCGGSRLAARRRAAHLMEHANCARSRRSDDDDSL